MIYLHAEWEIKNEICLSPFTKASSATENKESKLKTQKTSTSILVDVFYKQLYGRGDSQHVSILS